MAKNVEYVNVVPWKKRQSRELRPFYYEDMQWWAHEPIGVLIPICKIAGCTPRTCDRWRRLFVEVDPHEPPKEFNWKNESD